MDRWKAEMRRVRAEKRREEKIKEEKVSRKNFQVREKVVKSWNNVFFPMACGSGGSKGRLAKSSGCGAARGDERWTIARHCGGKHICKLKCTKHTRLRSLYDVQMSFCMAGARACGTTTMTTTTTMAPPPNTTQRNAMPRNAMQRSAPQQALRYNDNHNYNCTTPHYIQQLRVRWPFQPLQPLKRI